MHMQNGKTYYVILCLVFLSGCFKKETREPFIITVISANYSMAYSIETIVTDSIVQAQFIGGLVGEKPKVLFRRELMKSELDSFYFYLKHESLDTLKRFYETYIPDGMQFFFRIDYQGKSKKVQLGNMWVPQLLRLTQIVNAVLPDSLKYSYWVAKYSNAP
jgi:hypothetical protein